MARPRVGDGGDGLQTWRAAEYMLNKQSRTADKEWGWVWSYILLTVRKTIRYEKLHMTSDLDGFLGTTYVKKNGHEVWHVEYEESLLRRYTDYSSKRNTLVR
jgi:hypothetical protein